MPPGFSQQQRQRLGRAARRGTLDELVARRPGLGQRLEAVANRGAGGQDRVAGLIRRNAAADPAFGQSFAQAAGTTPSAPPSAGGATPSQGKTPPAGSSPSAPTPAPAPVAPPSSPPAPPPSFSSILTQQFGTGNPFGPSDISNNPAILGARDEAQALLDRNLQGITSRFGAAGGGQANSARSAFERGAASGEAAAGLGRFLGQFGTEQRQRDLDRAGNLLLGADQNALQSQNLALQGLNQLGTIGSGLLALQGQEQVPPLLSLLLPFLTNFGLTTGIQTPPGGITQA